MARYSMASLVPTVIEHGPRDERGWDIFSLLKDRVILL